MVSRTAVLPAPVVGQVVAVLPTTLIEICASVMPGSSEEAACRTTALASTGSLRSAIARTPSRAAADSVPCTWKVWPNSAMPSTSRRSSGTMKANSTALAPRSSRSRAAIPAHHLSSCSGAAAPRRAGPLRRNSRDRVGSASLGLHRAGDVVEHRLQVVAEQGDGGDDHDGDQADHEAVLDGGGALLLALETSRRDGDQADDGGVGLLHVRAPEGSAGRPGSADPALRRWV